MKWLQQRRANERQLKLIFKVAALQPTPAASSALALRKLNPRKRRSLACSSPPTSSSPTFFHPSDRNPSSAHSHGQIHSVEAPPSPPAVQTRRSLGNQPALPLPLAVGCLAEGHAIPRGKKNKNEDDKRGRVARRCRRVRGRRVEVAGQQLRRNLV